MMVRFTGLALVIAAAVVTASCGGKTGTDPGATDDSGAGDKATVQVTVEDLQGLSAQSKYMWLFLFDGTCPNDADLAYGKVSSAFLDQKVPQIDIPFTMSNLDKKPMGFAAMLRKDDCSVLAFGCTPADLTKHKSITIAMDAVIPPAGTCESGKTCSDAKCK